ncbi:Secreted phosphoprotein 24 [Heterocephalus glaber]|uniref:Secreted phosphoprotein 24 n=1 Tax=Heterocephalus glaber TaxID=10181 RepID=G5BRP8_HETGA|nr:Secreted phosphoprotein 24 [Heterocephalus glaber]
MEKTVMKILIIFALGMNYWSCSGFPVFDYDPSSLHEALSASVAKVNSQLLSPYLFRAFRSSLKRVNALGEDSVIMSLEFSVRETTCLRGSVEDPSACAFQRGYYAQTAACRSTVQILGEQVQQVWAHCRWPDTSESSSSEESPREGVFHLQTEGSPTTGTEQGCAVALSDTGGKGGIDTGVFPL